MIEHCLRRQIMKVVALPGSPSAGIAEFPAGLRVE
jgi:hypothetical protein